MTNLTNLKGVKTLNRNEQKSTIGGCPTYTASQCLNCGGYPLPNGCCLGTEETHSCLTGNFQ